MRADPLRRPGRRAVAVLVLSMLAGLACAAPSSAGKTAPPHAGKAAPAAGAPKAPEAPAPRVVILLRHGQYAPDPAADKDLGPGLTPLGVAQAHLAGARLAALTPRIDEIYASPLTRARDTAMVVAQDLGVTKITTVPELAECTPPGADIVAADAGAQAEMDECAKRLDQVFAAHFRPAAGTEQRELLVCHGNVIRYMVTKALRVDTNAWVGMSFGHASLTTVRINADGTMEVIAAGDNGHLPPSLHTGSRGDPERTLAVPN